ncbi:MAG: FTR1 family protein [Chitinophagales bacterium]
MNLNKEIGKLVGAAMLLFTVVGSANAAANPEHARLLVHTLNYLSRDYANAIDDKGGVKSAAEYKEMTEFGELAVKYTADFKSEWTPASASEISSGVHILDSLVSGKAPFGVVRDQANSLKAKVIAASSMIVTPSSYPSLAAGKAVFAAQCARCHGSRGMGDGKEGLQLNPPPRNFHDQERMKMLSAFGIFNTVRLGVNGTGMKAHPELTDEEVWNVSFYVMTLRQQNPGKAPRTTDLKTIATFSDQEFSEQHYTKEEIAGVRFFQPEVSKMQFIVLSEKYMDEALNAARNGNYEEARQLATLSYLEGFEPVEKQLRATDPELIARMEEQMANVRKMLEENRPLHEVSDSIKSSKALIVEAGKILEKKDVSFGLALLLAISILLREGLEAFLIIMVILSVLKNTGMRDAKHYVHAGWIAAVAGGFLLWMAGTQLLPDMSRIELMEGVVAIMAVAMLLYVGFWMHGKSRSGQWKEYVETKLKNLEGGSLWGLFILSFIVVFREVFESVLFLSTLHMESHGKQGGAIALGVILAFFLVAALTILALRFSARLPIPRLFAISSWLMAALAVILAGKGLHSFQETGWLTVHGVPLLTSIDWLGIFPTVETLTGQCVVLAFSVFLMRWAKR